VNPLNNINIGSVTEIPTPREIQRELPVPPRVQHAVLRFRGGIEDILDGRDPRLLMVVGPCSIHDTKAGVEYAGRLARLAQDLNDQLLIVMRVYYEKPRTSVGWKGLINDPFMDDSFRIDQGLRIARRFLLDVAELGLPAGTEALDPLTPQYIGDLVSWTAIGARTTESQTHREMASGLSTPVGFKNGTDGSVETAINAIRSALRSHHFLGVTDEGRQAVFCTTGNPYPHVVLRGGTTPNYSSRHIQKVEKALAEAKLPVRIVVDCSHGNSEKDPRKQGDVLRDCLSQIEAGNTSIVGFMMESHLHWGNQPIQRITEKMDYGVSVTDACMDWETTERLLREAHDRYSRILHTVVGGTRNARADR
jgi:3-deoxy-7-phosphoheptulonate synthase